MCICIRKRNFRVVQCLAGKRWTATVACTVRAKVSAPNDMGNVTGRMVLFNIGCVLPCTQFALRQGDVMYQFLVTFSFGNPAVPSTWAQIRSPPFTVRAKMEPSANLAKKRARPPDGTCTRICCLFVHFPLTHLCVWLCLHARKCQVQTYFLVHAPTVIDQLGGLRCAQHVHAHASAWPTPIARDKMRIAQQVVTLNGTQGVETSKHVRKAVFSSVWSIYKNFRISRATNPGLKTALQLCLVVLRKQWRCSMWFSC